MSLLNMEESQHEQNAQPDGQSSEASHASVEVERADPSEPQGHVDPARRFSEMSGGDIEENYPRTRRAEANPKAKQGCTWLIIILLLLAVGVGLLIWLWPKSDAQQMKDYVIQQADIAKKIMDRKTSAEEKKRYAQKLVVVTQESGKLGKGMTEKANRSAELQKANAKIQKDFQADPEVVEAMGVLKQFGNWGDAVLKAKKANAKQK
jgi:uncharacterized protein HemX